MKKRKKNPKKKRKKREIKREEKHFQFLFYCSKSAIKNKYSLLFIPSQFQEEMSQQTKVDEKTVATSIQLAASHMPVPIPESMAAKWKLQTHGPNPNPHYEKAKDDLSTAGTAAAMMAPTFFIGGLCGMIDTSKDDQQRAARGKKDDVMTVLNALGFFFSAMAVMASPVADTIKLPIAATWSLGSLVRAGYRGIRGLFYKDPAIANQVADIAASFEQRLFQTMSILISLGVETKASLYVRCKDKRKLSSLFAMTTLSTALGSRGLSSQRLVLANGFVLDRQNCPPVGLKIFDCVLSIRDDIRGFGFHNHSNQELIAMVMPWIPSMFDALDARKDLPGEFDHRNTQPGFLYVLSLVRNLNRIAKESTHFSFLNGAVDRIDWDGLDSVEKLSNQALGAFMEHQAEEKRMQAKGFKDRLTGQPLTNAVMSINGFFYNKETLDDDSVENVEELRPYILIRAGGGPLALVPSGELGLDPLYNTVMEKPVLADDGYFYDRATAERLIATPRKMRVCGHVPITTFYACKESL